MIMQYRGRRNASEKKKIIDDNCLFRLVSIFQFSTPLLNEKFRQRRDSKDPHIVIVCLREQ